MISGFVLVGLGSWTQTSILAALAKSLFPITTDFLLMFNLWQLLSGQWPRSDGALFPLCQVQLALCSSHSPQAPASALRRGAGGRCSEIRASSSQASLHKNVGTQLDGWRLFEDFVRKSKRKNLCRILILLIHSCGKLSVDN